jgi:acyl carrier protein
METTEYGTRERVLELLRSELGLLPDQEITDESRLEDLGATSMDRYEVSLALEETFDIEIPDAEIEGEAFQTVGGVIAYVEQHAK